MRKWFASLAVLGLSAVATAQTIPVPPVGGLGQSQSLVFDSGTGTTAWKNFQPTGALDAFSVDIDEMGTGMEVAGIALGTYRSTSTGPLGIKYLAIAGDSVIDTLGHTPDLSTAQFVLGNMSGTVTITGTPGITGGFCPGLVGYGPSGGTGITIGAGGMHAVMNFLTGDSGTWLCSESSAPDNRSFWTFNNYSTVANPQVGQDYLMRVIGSLPCTPGAGPSAYLTVNNGTGTVHVKQDGFLAATLWSCCAIQPTAYIQGIQIPPYPFFQIPAFLLLTGYENGSPIADSKQGTVGDYISDPSTGPCVPANVSFNVFGYYLDNCDLKKNGKPKVKQTNTVVVVTDPNYKACNPCVCFGQCDDGSQDSFIWKVQNPAGSGDYHNANFGGTSDPAGNSCGVTSVNSIQISSWDFCGTGTTTGPSWASIGLYEGSTVDPAGTPDLSAVIASCSTLSMPVNSANFGYPATTYDFVDVFTTTSSALANMTNGHVAAKWPTGDTCIWMGSDTDASDDASSATDTCNSFPSTNSYLTLTSYSTTAIQATYATWMMKIDWS